MRVFYAIMLGFLLISCRSGGPPAGALNEEQFVAAYCDLLEASLRSRNTRADSATAAGNASAALNNAGVSREAFDLTRLWYGQDVNRWKAFMDKVSAELERREMKPPPRP